MIVDARLVFARVALGLVVLALLCVASTASAHAIGLSRGEYVVDGAEVHAEVVLRADEAALAAPGLDADGDGRITESEIAAARAAIRGGFVDALAVTGDGMRCAGRFVDASLVPPDGLRVRATYECPHAPARVRLRFGFLERLPAAHRHLATITSGGHEVQALAVLSNPIADVDVATPETGRTHGFVSMLRGGIEHILTGADHLAFLLALVIGGVRADPPGARVPYRERAMPLVKMLTAFTVGHSASLAIATLGGFAPSARFVEPAVALSVAYVGAENLFTKSTRHRWMITLPFGFVHGFAFAGGLLPLGLPRSELPTALLAFNLGVEVGQLAVLAVFLPPMEAARSRGWYAQIARAVSVAVVVAGLGWFVQRVA